jgi:hypothetical protein
MEIGNESATKRLGILEYDQPRRSKENTIEPTDEKEEEENV